MKRMSGEIGDPDPTRADGDPRRDVQAVGEDSELVGLAVAVGIFEDLDAGRDRVRPNVGGYSRLSR